MAALRLRSWAVAQASGAQLDERGRFEGRPGPVPARIGGFEGRTGNNGWPAIRAGPRLDARRTRLPVSPAEGGRGVDADRRPFPFRRRAACDARPSRSSLSLPVAASSDSSSHLPRRAPSLMGERRGPWLLMSIATAPIRPPGPRPRLPAAAIRGRTLPASRPVGNPASNRAGRAASRSRLDEPPGDPPALPSGPLPGTSIDFPARAGPRAAPCLFPAIQTIAWSIRPGLDAAAPCRNIRPPISSDRRVSRQARITIRR